jgi:hypothetical protein
MMFIMGTGSTLALTPPMYWYSGRARDSAAARAVYAHFHPQPEQPSAET